MEGQIETSHAGFRSICMFSKTSISKHTCRYCGIDTGRYHNFSSYFVGSNSYMKGLIF